MAFKIEVNGDEIARILKSDEMGAAVKGLTEAIAAKVELDETEPDDAVEVDEYETDRKAGAVRVPAYAQVRDGALTKAVGALGLRVNAP